MKTVPLHGKRAAGRVVLVDDEDYDLVMQYRWFVWERVSTYGTIDGPYATANRPRPAHGTVRMHRLLIPEGSTVDHEDGNGLNNQRYNLRPATKGQNMANSRKIKANGGATASSGFKGVHWDAGRSKWQAAITVNGVTRFLGRFPDEADAALAYDVAAREVFGEFARLNFPQDAA